jgi:hypothetical protein
MNKDQFKNRKIVTKEVEYRESPESEPVTFHIRKLTEAETREVGKKYATNDKAMDGMRYIMSRVVVEESSSTVRVFNDDDAKPDGLLSLQPFDMVQVVSDAAMVFSGLKKPEKKDDEENPKPSAAS